MIEGNGREYMKTRKGTTEMTMTPLADGMAAANDVVWRVVA